MQSQQTQQIQQKKKMQASKKRIELNKFQQFNKYVFNYKNKVGWGNQKKLFYYQGRQITNPTSKAFLHVVENTYQNQSIVKQLEQQLKCKKILNNNQRVQILLEIQVFIPDQTLNKLNLNPCLVMRALNVLENSPNDFQQESQKKNIIKLKKFQFNLKDKLQIDSQLGQTYQGYQIDKPMDRVFIQVLQKPYQHLEADQIEKLVQQIEAIFTISQRWAIGHFDGGKAFVSNQNLYEWTQKHYMILELVENSFLTSPEDIVEIQKVIKENGIIKVCDGKYQLNSNNLLGHGGQGYVYLGVQTNNPSNKVAIKIISSRFQDFSDKKRQRLNRELNIMKYLNPEYAVRLLDEGQTQVIDQLCLQNKVTKLKYFVMELMDGSLEQLYFQILKPIFAQNKQQGIRFVKYYFFRVVLAYSACYQNNVAHQDLKPQNILIKKSKQSQGLYQIKIADFGISMHQTCSSINQMAGTTGYSSPQQKLNLFYTYKCDIYALGGILIYLILGTNPVALKVISNNRLNKQKLCCFLKDFDDQSRSIFKFLQRCLAYQQYDRYQYDQVLTHSIFNSIRTQDEIITILNKISIILKQKRMYFKSLKYMEKAIQILQKTKEKENMNRVILLKNIGSAYYSLGDYEKALKKYEQSHEITQRIMGKGSIDTSSIINNIGLVKYSLGDYQNALIHFEQSLEIEQKIRGKGSIDAGLIINNIASVYYKLRDYKKALQKYEQSLYIQKKIKGKGSINTALTLRNIGSVYMNLGYQKKAIEYYEQCLQIQQKIKGKGSIDTAQTLNIIGQFHKKQGNYQKALKSFQQCLYIQQKIKGSSDTALTLSNIGSVFMNLGDYKKALEKFQQCLFIQQKAKGKGNIDTALTLNNIGLAYQNLGDIKNALQNYEQCLKIKKKILGEGNIDTALTLKNIGSVYNHSGCYKNAIKNFKQCLKILQQLKGKESIDAALTLRNIGLAYFNLKDFKKALKYYQKCLKIQKLQGKANVETATTLENVCIVYLYLRDYANALKFFEQCLQIQQIVKGKDSIDVAITLENIGKTYRNLKDYKNAVRKFEQSLKIQQKIKGQPIINTEATLENIKALKQLMSQQKNDQEFNIYCQKISIKQLSQKKTQSKCLTIMFKQQNFYLVDCPGLLDSEGFQDGLINSYFFMKVFETVKDKIAVYGYPFQFNQEQKQQIINIQKNMDRMLQQIIFHKATTSTGQSGSPILRFNQRQRQRYEAVGIHTNRNIINNSGMRIKSDVLIRINKWIQAFWKGKENDERIMLIDKHCFQIVPAKPVEKQFNQERAKITPDKTTYAWKKNNYMQDNVNNNVCISNGGPSDWLCSSDLCDGECVFTIKVNSITKWFNGGSLIQLELMDSKFKGQNRQDTWNHSDYLNVGGQHIRKSDEEKPNSEQIKCSCQPTLSSVPCLIECHVNRNQNTITWHYNREHQANSTIPNSWKDGRKLCAVVLF